MAKNTPTERECAIMQIPEEKSKKMVLFLLSNGSHLTDAQKERLKNDIATGKIVVVGRRSNKKKRLALIKSQMQSQAQTQKNVESSPV